MLAQTAKTCNETGKSENSAITKSAIKVIPIQLATKILIVDALFIHIPPFKS